MTTTLLGLPPAAGPLYTAAVAPGGDPVACLVLADLLEEVGDTVGAAAWRWLGCNHEVLYGDKASDNDPFAECLCVADELLPATVRYFLPRPLIDDNRLLGETQRIMPSMWVSRQAFIHDFLGAWRLTHEVTPETFRLESD